MCFCAFIATRLQEICRAIDCKTGSSKIDSKRA